MERLQPPAPGCRSERVRTTKGLLSAMARGGVAVSMQSQSSQTSMLSHEVHAEFVPPCLERIARNPMPQQAANPLPRACCCRVVQSSLKNPYTRGSSATSLAFSHPVLI